MCRQRVTRFCPLRINFVLAQIGVDHQLSKSQSTRSRLQPQVLSGASFWQTEQTPGALLEPTIACVARTNAQHLSCQPRKKKKKEVPQRAILCCLCVCVSCRAAAFVSEHQPYLTQKALIAGKLHFGRLGPKSKHEKFSATFDCPLVSSSNPPALVGLWNRPVSVLAQLPLPFLP